MEKERSGLMVDTSTMHSSPLVDPLSSSDPWLTPIGYAVRTEASMATPSAAAGREDEYEKIHVRDHVKIQSPWD